MVPKFKPLIVLLLMLFAALPANGTLFYPIFNLQFKEGGAIKGEGSIIDFGSGFDVSFAADEGDISLDLTEYAGPATFSTVTLNSLYSANPITIKPSGDTDDYFELSTVDGAPTVGTVGDCPLRMVPSNGELQVHEAGAGGEFVQFILGGGAAINYVGSISDEHLAIQKTANTGITMFEEASGAETPEFKIYGFRLLDALRSLEIGVGVDAADTVSFDGLSNYRFDGNAIIIGAVNTGTWQATVIDVLYGGTGTSALTDGGPLLGSGTGPITAMAVLADGEFIVGDGTTAPVAESGDTARTSLGLGTGDTPTFAGATFNCVGKSEVTVDSGDFVLSGGTRNYIFGEGPTTDAMAIWETTSGNDSFIELFSTDGDETDKVGMKIYGKGTKTDITNSSFLNMYWQAASPYDFIMETTGSGTYTPRDLRLKSCKDIIFDATGNVDIRSTWKADGETCTDIGEVTTGDWNGGTIDNTAVGDETPAAGTFTGLTSGASTFGDGGTTNYTEVKADGEINLHGTARVTRHLRVGTAEWYKGANAPASSEEGVFSTLDFDAASDDECYFELIVPWRWDSSVDVEFAVDWFYDGGASPGTVEDAGTVCWALEYLAVKAGEDVTTAGTTITKVSSGNHNSDRLVRTVFVTKIVYGNLEVGDTVGLRLYRDVSADTLAADARMLNSHFHFTENKLGQAL